MTKRDGTIRERTVVEGFSWDLTQVMDVNAGVVAFYVVSVCRGSARVTSHVRPNEIASRIAELCVLLGIAAPFSMATAETQP